MGVDRVLLGSHSNTSLGTGLYVSAPGANVLHPEHAQFSNLMFDSNRPNIGTFRVIQSGTFKITCSRQAVSPRGYTIGTRPADTSSIGTFSEEHPAPLSATPDSTLPFHTYDHDTGRPSALMTFANTDIAEGIGSTLWKLPKFFAGAKTKQGNYLDTGSQHITIANPLARGEIPKVALRFAVGNSSGHFHPWYANTQILSGRTGGNWNDIDYASSNTQQIVHMDSNWMRLKWGGLGAESYRASQEEFSYEDLVEYYEGDEQLIADRFGFVDIADAREKIKTHSKLFSLAITNSQGVVGLIPYVNSTSITVDAYMSPTHAGLRQPLDRTFTGLKRRQKSIGFNAIEDYANINFPIETLESQHSGGGLSLSRMSSEGLDFSNTTIQDTLNAPKFQHLPGIPIAKSRGFSLTNLSAGTRHPVTNEISDGNLLPYGHDTMVTAESFDEGKRDMYGWGGHPSEFFVNPFSNGNCTFYTHMQAPYFTDRIYGNNTAISGATTQYGVYHKGYVGQYLPVGYENESPSSWSEDWPGMMPEHTTWGPLIEQQHINNGQGPYLAKSTNNLLWSNTAKSNWPKGVDIGPNPYPDAFNGTGVHWPPGHPYADYFDYRDWMGSMGLDGAGSKESLAKEDCWDTFYCSYVVYSSSASAPAIASAQAPKTIFIDARDVSKGGDMRNSNKYRNDHGENQDPSTDGANQRYFNLVFPDDYVGTIGDAGTDPFSHHRDPVTQKIYGNVNIVFKIPQVNGSNVEDPVKIGSEDFIFDDYVIGGTTYPNAAFTGKPAPAIVFDLSDSKFMFENNKNITLTIENNGYVLGGSGAGGRGGKGLALGDFFTPGAVDTPAPYGGGGGGAGAGSGFERPSVLFGRHPGTGMGGYGFGRGEYYGDAQLPSASDRGEDGQNLLLIETPGSPGGTMPSEEYSRGGMPGGAAATEKWESTQLLFNFTPYTGGPGGDVFSVKHGDVLPRIEIINQSPLHAPGDPEKNAYIASGGGGGGGGWGRVTGHAGAPAVEFKVNGIVPHAKGADGGSPGQNANAEKGGPGVSSNFEGDVTDPQQFVGGWAGYIISSYNSSTTGGAYTGIVTIVNNSNKSVIGRGVGTSFQEYTVDFSVGSGETKQYK